MTSACMIDLTDQTIVRLLLDFLVERMDAGVVALDQLINAGVDPVLLDLLRQRPARDLIRIAKVEALGFKFTFDNRAVIASLTRNDAIKRDAELCDYFVRNGAPPELLSDLFKLSAEEIRFQRKVLLPDGQPPGRPKLPPLPQRERIHNDWARLTKQKPDASLRERLYELHRLHSAWSIHALWTALNEFEAPPPKRAIR